MLLVRQIVLLLRQVVLLVRQVVLFIKKTFGGSGYESVTNEEVCDENNYHYEVFILFADEDQDYVTSSIFEFCSGIVVTDR